MSEQQPEGVGAFIERRRKELGLSQAEVARRIEMPESQLNKMIRQRPPDYLPDLTTQQRLAAVLACSIFDLQRAAGWPVASGGEEDDAAELRRWMARVDELEVSETAKAWLRESVRQAERELRQQSHGPINTVQTG